MQSRRLQERFEPKPDLAYPHAEPGVRGPWSDRLRHTVRRLLGEVPTEPLEVRSVDSGVLSGLTLEEYVFDAPGRGAFRGAVVRPAGDDPVPGVLLCPGRNAPLAKVTGTAPPDYPDQDMGPRLARRGVATLTLEYGLLDSWGAERVDRRDEVNLLALAAGLVGASPLAWLVGDALRGLTWMEEQPWLAPGRLAVFGRSLGGHVALHAALAGKRPLSVGLSSCLGRYREIFLQDLTGGGAHALPSILRYADLPDLVAALAPLPLQVQHGSEDPIVPVAGMRRAMDVVERSYRDAGGVDLLEARILPMGHSTDVELLGDFLLSSTDRLAPAPVEVPPARVVFSPRARTEILDRIDDSLSRGQLTLGPYGSRFEDRCREWTGAPAAVAVSSGTSAVEIACRVVGVEGRDVLVPANTFFATASAALHAGARVDFVDIEEEGLGMCPEDLRRALDRSPDPAAVVLVHIGGIVAPSVREVLEICAERRVAVIEDAAHALGGELDGDLAGGFGRMGAFSMYPTKIVTSGEGGFVSFESPEDAEIARCLRDQGKHSFHSNVHSRQGSNWRMSEPHAAIGISHLDRLAGFLEERRRLAAVYDRELESVPGLRPFPISPGTKSNYYKYIALLDPDVDRARLKGRLAAEHRVRLSGEVYEIPCCAQPFFGHRFPERSYPRAYEFCRRHVALPLFQNMTAAEQAKVIEALTVELGGAGSRSPELAEHL